MAKINIKFGYPTSWEELDLLSDRAVNNDCSIETALCFEFECLLDSLCKRKGKDNFFDLVFLVATQRQVVSPKIHFDVYFQNGHKLPMMVLEDDYLQLQNSERLFISNNFVDELGNIYQTEFDYEYAGLERANA
jgi:hypothetical protein